VRQYMFRHCCVVCAFRLFFEKEKNMIMFLPVLGSIWILPSFLSFTPIFLGIYTTQEYLDLRKENPELCDFVPNTGKLRWKELLDFRIIILRVCCVTTHNLSLLLIWALLSKLRLSSTTVNTTWAYSVVAFASCCCKFHMYFEVFHNLPG